VTPFFVICKHEASSPVVPDFTGPRNTGVVEFLCNSSKLENSWDSFYISWLTINSCHITASYIPFRRLLRKGIKASNCSGA